MVAAEPIPLLDEVVAAVVADLRAGRMGAREAGDVRRVDHDLAAVGDDRLDLVEALRTGPDFVVPGGQDRQDSRTGASR